MKLTTALAAVGLAALFGTACSSTDNADAGSPNPSDGGCSLIGTWNATFATDIQPGQPVTGTITIAASSLSATFNIPGVNLGPGTQDYTLSGDQLSMTNSGGALACPEPTVVADAGLGSNGQPLDGGPPLPDVGVYTITFSNECSKFTMAVVSDPCSVANLGGDEHRAEDLNGAFFTK